MDATIRSKRLGVEPVKKLVRISYHRPSRRSFLGGAGAAGIALVFDLGLLGCGEDSGDDDSTAPPGDDDSAWTPDDPPRARIVSGPVEIEAGRSGTWTLEVEIGEHGLRAGDGLAVCVEHGTDWHGSRDEYGNPVERLGGLRVECDGDATFEVLSETFTSAGNAAEFLVAGGELVAGQRVWITVGDPDDGGVLYAPSMVHEAQMHVFEHLDGELTEDGFRLYTELLPTPLVTVVPRAAAALGVLARSHAAVDEPLSVVLRVEDELGNVVPTFRGDALLYDDAGGDLLWSGTFAEQDAGVARVEGVVVSAAGVVRLRAELPDPGIVAYGGPVEIGGEASPVRWGQIHGHSIVSDGLGTAAQWYAYARGTSNLDFAALSDHGYLTERVMDHQFFRHDILEADWQAYVEATRAAHQPGEFVSFLGYEWTSNLYSDKCVYFLHDDEPWEPFPATLEDLYDRYGARADRVTIVSHMMWATPFMRATDWGTFDDELERVVEVASVHGVREYAGNPYWTSDDVWAQVNALAMAGSLVADGLARGHRLGLVCGDDCHQGFPGNSHRGRHPCRCTGLMAVRADELTRGAIWEMWRARHTWGTTGPRVLLGFSCCGAQMGDEVVWPADQPRELRVEACAPRPITRIEIVRDDPESPVHVQEYAEPVWNPPPLEWTDETTLEGEAFYYARIFVEDDDFAGSSPIWVVVE